jgi:hypothetical protein
MPKHSLSENMSANAIRVPSDHDDDTATANRGLAGSQAPTTGHKPISAVNKPYAQKVTSYRKRFWALALRHETRAAGFRLDSTASPAPAPSPQLHGRTSPPRGRGTESVTQ